MARTKSEAKRQAILKIAADAFLENGYERTSMSTISERLGGSKATLYNYFKSKDELFLAVLDFEIETNAEAILAAAFGEHDVRKGLTIVATGYLMQRLSVRPTRYFRMVSGQSGESEIGEHFWNNVLKPAWMLMCERIEQFMAEGQLRQADPWTATMHFKGLVDHDLVERRLLGVIRAPDIEECRRVAEVAVDAFLRIYGVDEDQKSAATVSE